MAEHHHAGIRSLVKAAVVGEGEGAGVGVADAVAVAGVGLAGQGAAEQGLAPEGVLLVPGGADDQELGGAGHGDGGHVFGPRHQGIEAGGGIGPAGGAALVQGG